MNKREKLNADENFLWFVIMSKGFTKKIMEMSMDDRTAIVTVMHDIVDFFCGPTNFSHALKVSRQLIYLWLKGMLIPTPEMALKIEHVIADNFKRRKMIEFLKVKIKNGEAADHAHIKSSYLEVLENFQLVGMCNYYKWNVDEICDVENNFTKENIRPDFYRNLN